MPAVLELVGGRAEPVTHLLIPGPMSIPTNLSICCPCTWQFHELIYSLSFDVYLVALCVLWGLQCSIA